MQNVFKQLQIDKQIKVGYSTAFLLLLISFLLTLYANYQLKQQTITINRTNTIILSLEDLISGLKDAETGARGYFLIKDEKFLEPYQSGIKRVDTAFKYLQAGYSDAAGESKNLDSLKRLIAGKYALMEYGLQNFRANKLAINDTQIKIAYSGKAVMDSIRNVIKSMQTNEKNVLIKKTKELENRYETMNIFVVTSLSLALVFAFYGLSTYIMENKARKIADNKVTEFQQQLQLRIDELDAANKELIQMRRLEKFAATGRIARNIAHEVRNPLTNIDLAIGQIKSEMPDTDESFSILFDMVKRNSKRINQLITELLNATRFSELNYQPMYINTLLDGALDLAKDRIELKQITVSKNYALSLNTISCDKEKLTTALLNIIVNAAEAMEKENGKLTISTREETNECVVEITDNGTGMDKETLSKLFEPYFTTKQKGNGLGLANTQNIILNHKGSIQVESTPGSGTTFTLRFDFSNK
jgi:signal transduction histidine kinase